MLIFGIVGDMLNGGGGWTYVARGNSVVDTAVGSVQTNYSAKGIWHMSVSF
eukprot:m.182165 g.182165  ORF g.182165 m.182165 type:complete len:51 (-) comp16879_c0_seq17:3602-3754(-)